MAMLRGILNGLVDIIYPKTCLACKGSLKGKSSIDNLVCQECWRNIKRNIPPLCRCCGRHLETRPPRAAAGFTKHICPACIRKKLYFDRAFSPCLYEGVIKELIHEFKYKGKDYLGQTLSNLMIEYIKEYNVPIKYLDFVIPVPLHKTRLREREFNQAQVLGRCISAEFNKEMLDGCLRRHRYTKTQTDLETSERLLNVKGSFSVDKREVVNGKNILLIDDVLTTGATASEAAYALKDAGTAIVFILTLAN
jgi:ComF family protein